MPDTVTTKGLKVPVKADTKEAQKQVDQLKKDVEGKPVKVKAEIDLSLIEKNLAAIVRRINQIADSFGKNVNFSALQKSILETEKMIDSMMTKIKGKKALNVNQLGFEDVKADINEIRTDLNSIGNMSLNLNALQDMKTLLQGIQDVLEAIRVGFHFDEILPTTVIEKEISDLNEQAEHFKKIQEEINKIAAEQYTKTITRGKNAGQTREETGSLWQNVNRKTAQNILTDSGYLEDEIWGNEQDYAKVEKIIKEMQKYVELGGNLADISFAGTGSYKDTVFNYLEVYEKLKSVDFDLGFENNAQVTGSMKELEEYQQKLERLNTQLDEAKAKESQTFQARFDDRSIEQFAQVMSEALQSVQTLQAETSKVTSINISSESLVSMEKHLQDISDVIQRITGIDLDKINKDLKENFSQKPIELEVKPIVSNPGAFVSEISSQLKGHPVEVEVQAKLTDGKDTARTNEKNNANDISSSTEKVALNKEDQNLFNLVNRINEIVSAINRKNEAFQSEGAVVSQVVKQEISSLNSLLQLIDEISKRIQILFSPQNNENNFELLNESQINNIKELKNVLDGFDSNGLLGLSANLFPYSKDDFSENIEKIAKALNNLKISLSGLSLNNSTFLSDIKEILDKGEELKNLSKVLESSIKRIEAAKKAVDSGKTGSDSEQAAPSKTKKTEAGPDSSQVKKAQKDAEVLAKTYERAQKELQLGLEKIEKTLDLGEISQIRFGSDNSATVTFVKRIGDEAESTTVKIKDLDAALDALNAGTFSNIYKDFSDVSQKTRIYSSDGEKATLASSTSKKAQSNLLGVLQTQLELTKHGGSGETSHITSEQLKMLQQYNSVVPNAVSNTLEFAKAVKELGASNFSFDSNNSIISEIKSVTEAYKEQTNSLISGFENDFARGDKSLDFKKGIDDLRVKVEELSSEKLDLNTEQSVKELQQIIAQIEQIKAELRSGQLDLADTFNVSKLRKQMADFAAKNNKAMQDSELGPQFTDLFQRFDDASDGMSLAQMKNFTSEFYRLSAATSEAGKTGGTFFDTWKKRMGDLGVYLASFASFYDIIDLLQRGIQTIRDLDTAFVEMQKVSSDSLSTLKAYEDLSFDLGNEVGTTGEQIMLSTADWMRLGEPLQEAQESAQTSNVLLNVSEFENIGTATDALVSVSQAYKDLTKGEIVDKLNNIGNNFSISTDGLASALQRSASALTTAGNDIDEASALIVAGNQIAQDPESVGAGMRTIALRIQGTEAAKQELEEMGEDTEDFVVTTTSKMDETIRNFTAVASNNFEGVSILDDNGNYRSTYEILQDIADIYDEIVASDKEFGTNKLAGLLEALAGKNRANIAGSIIQNSEVLRSAYEASQNSEGSAEQELNKYLDSVEGRITRLVNSAQELAFNLIDTDLFKGLVDGANTLLNVLNEIVSVLGLFPTLLAGGGIAAFIKNLDKPKIKGFVY